MRRFALLLVALLVATATGGAAAISPTELTGSPVSTPANATPEANAPLDGRFDVGGGRMLHLHCEGAGSPTVVLEAGYGGDLTAWNHVQPAVATFSRVCSYDRAGLGESDPAPSPRTAADVVADLSTLLHTAGVSGPYVLVGHSAGGLAARLFASTYPTEVVGLVLVDALHEDYLDRLAALDPDQASALLALLAMVPEGVDFAASFEQVRGGGSLPTVPAVIIARGELISFPPLQPTAETERLWQELQGDLVTHVPNAEFVVADQSGHDIPTHQPEIVIEGIRRVVEAARRA